MEHPDLIGRLPVRVTKYSAKHYRASLARAGGSCLSADGATAREAREALMRAVEWAAHMTDVVEVRDGCGAVWILYVGPVPDHWIARRLYPGGTMPYVLSPGSTHFHAPSFSAARDQIKAWNAPTEAADA